MGNSKDWPAEPRRKSGKKGGCKRSTLVADHPRARTTRCIIQYARGYYNG